MKIKVKTKKEAASKLRYDYKKYGVTQSLLSRWLGCRESCAKFLEGWSPRRSSFSQVFGHLTHGCLERVYEGIRRGKIKDVPTSAQVKTILAEAETLWLKENPRADNTTKQGVEISLLIAEATLPLYFKFWKKDDFKCKWQQVEKEFAVPFTDNRGRVITLRGKRDGAYTLANGKSTDMWLFETKTKSMIDEAALVDYLPLDMQVNLYVYTLMQEAGRPVLGVLYNIIRRVCLKQNKNESNIQFAKRVVADIEKRPDFYFMRLEIGLSKSGLLKWERSFRALITDFIDWCEGAENGYRNPFQCINKYGRCEFMPVCTDEDYSSLIKRPQLFNELEEI